MTTAHNPDGDSSVWYREDHCVLRCPMVVAGLIAPVAVIAIFVLGVVLQSAVLLVVMLIPIIFWIARGQLLVHWWPIGIRPRPGAAVGGVRWAERHPGKRHRKASVLNQGYQVFSCPWDGVIWTWVETDSERLKGLRRGAAHGRRRTPLGNLSVPFMTAALVIRVDPSVATVPAIHPARSPLAVNYSSLGYQQDRWAVPTRHPDRLRKALASRPLPPGVVIAPTPLTRASDLVLKRRDPAGAPRVQDKSGGNGGTAWRWATFPGVPVVLAACWCATRRTAGRPSAPVHDCGVEALHGRAQVTALRDRRAEFRQRASTLQIFRTRYFFMAVDANYPRDKSAAPCPC
jgi:hypothetical protein